MSTGTGTGGQTPQHDLLRGLDLLTEALDLIVAAPPGWSLSDRQVRDALVGLDTQLNRGEAAKLALVRESVAREDGPHAGRETRRLLKRRCHASAARAGADVANAALLADHGDLPQLGQALAAGQVGREHLDVARRCLQRIPRQLVHQHGPTIDQTLTEHARQWNPQDAAVLAAHVLATIAPDSTDRYDPDALDRHQLHTGTDTTGMLLVRGRLDPATGHKFKAILAHLANLDRTPHPPNAADSTDSADGAGAEGAEQMRLPVPDLRTAGQRNADAFTRMVDLAAEQLALDPDTLTTKAARAVPRVVVLTTPDQLAGAPGAGAATLQDGTLLDHGTLTRHGCDAIIDRVILSPTGQILRMSTLGRLATDAQTTALAARDGGCAWPGCTAPPAHCEAHHVIWWCRGGPTTTDNLALLCTSHHTQIHTEQWHITMHDGTPWFTPPEHLDPHRRPIRNTLRDAVHHARSLGQQLRLDLDPPRRE